MQSNTIKQVICSCYRLTAFTLVSLGMKPSGWSTRLPTIWPGFESTLYASCGLSLLDLRAVRLLTFFSRVLRFSPLTKNQNLISIISCFSLIFSLINIIRGIIITIISIINTTIFIM